MPANKQNLKIPTSEEARVNGRKGGLASAKKRAEMKTAKEFAIAALSAEITDKSTGKKTVVKDALIQTLVGKAIGGKDMQAIKYVLDLIGEGAVTKTDITTNGKELNREPIILEIIDRMEQVDENSNDANI